MPAFVIQITSSAEPLNERKFEYIYRILRRTFYAFKVAVAELTAGGRNIIFLVVRLSFDIICFKFDIFMPIFSLFFSSFSEKIIFFLSSFAG